MRLRFPRLGPRALVGLLVLAAILVGVFFWVRQSSLVAVRRVTITGLSGPDASQIRTAIAQAALGMSTLDVNAQRLHEAVAPYSVVHALTLSSHFPHGLTVAVDEEIPVAVIVAGGQQVTVSANGRLLSKAGSTAALPTITVASLPVGRRATGVAGEEVAMLAAAPYAFIARIATAEITAGRGLAVTLRNGPAIVFGDDTQLRAKWRSAVTALASAGSAGASYIDVTSPSRPAAGTGSDTAAGAGAAGSPTTSTAAPSASGG